MITINTELKPCPFCGGQPRTSVNYRQCGGGDLVLEFAISRKRIIWCVYQHDGQGNGIME